MSAESRSPVEHEIWRRRFIREAAACVATPLWLNAGSAPAVTAQKPRETDAMEGALDRLSGLARLTYHGPMTEEALVALGRAGQVVAWVEGYQRRFTNAFPVRWSTR